MKTWSRETFCFVPGNGRKLSVGVDEEAGEGAVFVSVSSMNFAPVQLHKHFVAYVQVQDDTVGGVVVVLICVLSDCTRPHLDRDRKGEDVILKEKDTFNDEKISGL